VRRDPAREREAQRREERPIGPDPIDDRPGRDFGECRGLRHHDPERLSPAEADEDRFAELEVVEMFGHEVGVRPVAAATGSIDRDLDGTRPRRGSGLTAQRRVELHGVANGQGDRE